MQKTVLNQIIFGVLLHFFLNHYSYADLAATGTATGTASATATGPAPPPASAPTPTTDDISSVRTRSRAITNGSAEFQGLSNQSITPYKGNLSNLGILNSAGVANSNTTVGSYATNAATVLKTPKVTPFIPKLLPKLSKNLIKLLPKNLVNAEVSPFPSRAQTLTLSQAIARAMQQNRTVLAFRLSMRVAEISYANAWDTMFMPSLNLVTSATPAVTFAHIPGQSTNTSNDSYGYPTGSVGLQLGQYTLYNFGKDRDTYEQARLDWVRTQQQYLETLRAVRIQVIIAYFRYKAEVEKLDAAKRSMIISEAFLAVVKSRVRISQANEGDIPSSEVDLVNAKNNYVTQDSTQLFQLYNLNLLLGDPIGTPYNPIDTIRYSPLQISQEMALRIYFENAPSMKDQRKNVLKAELALDIARKNLLPLPKVSLSGLNLTYTNNYGAVTNTFTNQASTPNIDVSAQISLTIPLIGPGGLFNVRTLAQSELSLDQANLSFETTANQDQLTILQTLRQIVQAEATIKNNREGFEKSNAVLEKLSDVITKGNGSRLEMRDALTNSRTFELSLNDSIVDHLQSKFSLAQLIGVDRLPGDIY